MPLMRKDMPEYDETDPKQQYKFLFYDGHQICLRTAIISKYGYDFALFIRLIEHLIEDRSCQSDIGGDSPKEEMTVDIDFDFPRYNLGLKKKKLKKFIKKCEELGMLVFVEKYTGGKTYHLDGSLYRHCRDILKKQEYYEGQDWRRDEDEEEECPFCHRPMPDKEAE